MNLFLESCCKFLPLYSPFPTIHHLYLSSLSFFNLIFTDTLSSSIYLSLSLNICNHCHITDSLSCWTSLTCLTCINTKLDMYSKIVGTVRILSLYFLHNALNTFGNAGHSPHTQTLSITPTSHSQKASVDYNTLSPSPKRISIPLNF